MLNIKLCQDWDKAIKSQTGELDFWTINSIFDRIHVWHIHLIYHRNRPNVGRYTIHQSYGYLNALDVTLFKLRALTPQQHKSRVSFSTVGFCRCGRSWANPRKGPWWHVKHGSSGTFIGIESVILLETNRSKCFKHIQKTHPAAW